LRRSREVAIVIANDMSKVATFPMTAANLANNAQARLLAQLLQAIDPSRKWNAKPLYEQPFDLTN
jgi:hypothetical protein